MLVGLRRSNGLSIWAARKPTATLVSPLGRPILNSPKGHKYACNTTARGAARCATVRNPWNSKTFKIRGKGRAFA
eukprot:6482006-Amphidinium_carterae.1